MIVATFPDPLLTQLVGPLPGVTVREWDWRHPTRVDRLETTNYLISEFSPEPPKPHVLSAMKDLRAVQLPSAGHAGWADVLPPEVTLCNGRSIHGQSTAEAALTGVLTLLRNIPQSIAAQREQRWESTEVEQLAGRTVVIVGAGDIGRRVNALFTAFGCSTFMVGRTERDGVRSAGELPALVGVADILVLTVPLDNTTRDLVDAHLLARLPDRAILANVSRGPVVNTAALTAEVASGRLRAYLDVTDPEPLPAGHPLWTLPGSLLTPHTGGGEVQWRSRYADLIRDQLTRLRDGLPLRNVVR